jgi:undecaprenyl-diphosphatase UppP
VPLLHAIILGIIQGLTEFLPVSSSAHLALIPWLLGWNDQGLSFDIALHVGTLAAVIVYFFRDWVQVIAEGFGLKMGADQAIRRNPRLLWLLVLGSVPAGIAGLLVKDLAENVWRNNQYLIGSMLILVGLFMWWADKQGSRRKDLGNVSPIDSLIIGAAQALALVPGVSRSGITICAGLMRNSTGLQRPLFLPACDPRHRRRRGQGCLGSDASWGRHRRDSARYADSPGGRHGRQRHHRSPDHPVLPELPPAEVVGLLRVVPGNIWHNSNRSGHLLPLPRGMRFLGPTRHARLNEAGAVVFLLAGLFLFFSLISYYPLDSSWNTAASSAKPVNLTGLVGASISDLLLQGFGLGAMWCRFSS